MFNYILSVFSHQRAVTANDFTGICRAIAVAKSESTGIEYSYPSPTEATSILKNLMVEGRVKLLTSSRWGGTRFRYQFAINRKGVGYYVCADDSYLRGFDEEGEAVWSRQPALAVRFATKTDAKIAGALATRGEFDYAIGSDYQTQPVAAA